MLSTTFHSTPLDQNPCERGFRLAQQLRQSKRTQILMQKRLKLSQSSQSNSQDDPYAHDVTPTDYLHLCSLGQDFELALPGLAKFLKDEKKVQECMKSTPVRTIN